MDRELATLPERMRLVFELSRKNNLSYKEIAEQLGITEKTVKNQVNGAEGIMREDGHVYLPAARGPHPVS